jgi:hypothetical protein
MTPLLKIVILGRIPATALILVSGRLKIESHAMNPELEAKLSRLFAAMEARKAAIRREREDQKLSRRRYWWQEQQTEQNNNNNDENYNYH